MWLESHQLNILPAYQSELNTIVIVLLQTTGHVPIHMHWIHLWEVLMEFSPDMDLCQFCDAPMENSNGWKHPIGEILNVEGLQTARVKT